MRPMRKRLKGNQQDGTANFWSLEKSKLLGLQQQANKPFRKIRGICAYGGRKGRLFTVLDVVETFTV